MRFFKKGTIISILTAGLLSVLSVGAYASTVTVTAADGESISFDNSYAEEIGKPITQMLSDVGEDKIIGSVISVRSDSIELIETDIYIRVYSKDKSAAENFKLEITDSAGKGIVASEIKAVDDGYAKDFDLGRFNSNTVTQTRIFNLISYENENVEISVISKPLKGGDYANKEGIRTVKRVGNITEEIKSGTYYLSTPKQLKITSPTGDIVMLKNAGEVNIPTAVMLNDGDIIEYYGTLYLSEENKNIKYLPYQTGTILQMIPGGMTYVKNGRLNVFDESGNMLLEKHSNFLKNASAYILNTTIPENESEAVQGADTIIKLKAGTVYTVGIDVGAGNYEGSGEGKVSVYDSAGYIKTVIKLKNENSNTEGIKSYVFKLSENETFVVDGNIEFKEVN